MQVRSYRSVLNILLLATGALLSSTIASFGQARSLSPNKGLLNPVSNMANFETADANTQNLKKCGNYAGTPLLARLDPNWSFQKDLMGLLSATGSAHHRDMPHTLAATYYSVNANLSATLILSNQGPHPMSVQITLFNLAGEHVDAPSTTIAPLTVQSFDLREWVALGGGSFKEGSLRVLYSGMNMELGGVLKLVDTERSLIFDEELTEPSMMFASSRLEATWWLPSAHSELRVAVSNTTPSAVVATIKATGARGELAPSEVLDLEPYQTRLIDVRKMVRHTALDIARTLEARQKRQESNPDMGGISITHSGSPGAVIARGFVQEPATGFSNVVEFFDPQTFKSSKLTGTGLRIGDISGQNLSQIVIARNVSKEETTLRGSLHYTLENGDTGELFLPEVRLGPGRTEEISVADTIGSNGLTNIAAAGLQFEYPASAGTVVMAALSMSADRNEVFRIPIVDAAVQMSSTGTYPWSIDKNHSTFVYLTNSSFEAKQYTMFIRFEGGAYTFGIKTLAPGQTIVVDLRKLRDMRTPDVNGKVLPPKASHGQVHWSVHEEDKRELIGRVEEVDTANGLSITSACGLCCADGFYSSWNDPASVTAVIRAQFNIEAWEMDEDCYGSQIGPFPRTQMASWSTSNSSVASGGPGITAAGVGTATISSSWNVRVSPERDPESGVCQWSDTPIQNDTSVTVVRAIPYNWTLTGETNLTNGTLFFTYSYGSTSGNITDIQDCTIGESVFYPGTLNPYTWPLPMVSSTPNPDARYTLQPSDVNGNAQDNNRQPTGYQQPYSYAHFTATQRFWFQCPGYNNGGITNFVPDLPIDRTVFKDNDNLWKYTITKSGYTNTVVLPNQ